MELVSGMYLIFTCYNVLNNLLSNAMTVGLYCIVVAISHHWELISGSLLIWRSYLSCPGLVTVNTVQGKVAR